VHANDLSFACGAGQQYLSTQGVMTLSKHCRSERQHFTVERFGWPTAAIN
jgi:hypothetical protein